MWQVTNTTPFPHFQAFERDKEGRSYWCVWLKASFRMRHNLPPLFIPEQMPVFQQAHYAGAVNETDLMSDSDLVLDKPAIDVVVVGFGANPGPETEPYVSSVQIGDWSKSVKVMPAAVRKDGGEIELYDPQPEAPVLLGYSNAFGGLHQRDEEDFAFLPENPIGRGFAELESDWVNQPLPRCLNPDQEWGEPLGKLTPCALTPVQRGWAQRACWAGTYDREWKLSKSPILPDDYDERFGQEAPEDQWLTKVPPVQTAITLENMTTRDGRNQTHFYTSLPHLALDCSTKFKGRWQDTPLKLQKIQILASKSEVSLTYLASMPILAVANDVKVEETSIHLRKGTNFRVGTDHVGQFDYFTASLEA